jgi:D-alanine-D-alanine ligase
MNILLIAGGWSKERQVALNGAKIIEKALENLGHKVTRFDPEHSLDGLCAAAAGQDCAFINLHGAPGEDGVVQAVLDAVGLPYQGSAPAGSFLALNKDAAKTVFRHHGLLTPDWLLLTARPDQNWRPPFDYPIFIKHNTGGSSLGLAMVSGPDELEAALDTLFVVSGEFIVEPLCRGHEVTCGVLGNLRQVDGKVTEIAAAMPPILIRPKHDGGKFFDYVSKYTKGAAEEICPAPLPDKVTKRVQELALKAHLALGLSGYSRSDFLLPGDDPDYGEPWLLEVNTLPGMTATSLVPQEAAVMGLSYEDLVARLIDLGLAAAQRRRKG